MVVDAELTDIATHRLWRDGMRGSEYFLVENRQQTGYDTLIPGGGLLVWHVDDDQPDAHAPAM